MPLHVLVYCSQAIPGLTFDQIDDLAKDAAAHNAIAGVTGVLLTDGKRSLQYLEGPEEGLALAYSRIINATSHLGVIELGRTEGGPRRLPYWSMRWLPVETEDLRIAEVSDWRGLGSRDEVDIDQVPTGIEGVAQLVIPYVDVGPLNTGPRGSPLL
ncbi:BLUF domain-containing protein [Stenotrophomonas bentonitica]